ncbi:microtubule-associated protein 6 homolog [Megalops cyprinoides]|uniref:microtubule-associated protein 6 homolog n=1 Tax=Megalops cyprinoides TaxID=118141 RepID=UPI001864EDD8|nr:microtubule-associated protein 6 homolog [Megalops cyprinoides]
MAWPCITRACCINRFWSELDKADIAVPLVFTKYSDVAEVQRLHLQPQPKQPHPQARASAVAIETQPSHSEREAVARAPPATAAAAGESSSASVMRQDFKAWKVRKEPSCKPKNEYHPSETPFNNETQYQKDFKPWPIPRRGDHPWIPKPTAFTVGDRPPRPKSAPTEFESGVEKSEIADKVQEKDMKERKKKQVKKEKAERRVSIRVEGQEPGGVAVEGRGRAAADALNRQIKQEVTGGSSYRNEFKAYRDVKPVKPIKAKSQYKPVVEDKASLQTSYSATFKGEQADRQTIDNKALERRRIRSLYSEPGGKEPSKVEKPSTPRSKPKKTTTTTTSHSKPTKKAKEKQATSVRGAKKKAAEEAKPEEGSKEKSKEINNKLAEAKE